MNDAAEGLLAPLGFNWQSSQAALVDTYYSNANAAGLYNQAQFDVSRQTGRDDVTSAPNTYSLYTLSQVQALNVDVPLIQRNATTGMLTLTIGVQKTTSLNLNLLGLPVECGGDIRGDQWSRQAGIPIHRHGQRGLLPVGGAVRPCGLQLHPLP
jgi:hypothetical protein